MWQATPTCVILTNFLYAHPHVRRFIHDSVVTPQPDPTGAEIVCLSFSRSFFNIYKQHASRPPSNVYVWYFLHLHIHYVAEVCFCTDLTA